MIRGGYHVVDFGDQNITTEAGVTIAGIYNSFEGSYRKAILVSGVTLEGVEQRDTFVDVTHGDNAYTFTAYGKTFTIANTDAVSVA